MTDEEVLKLYDEMVEMYGDKLPNPEHEPRQFQYYIKLYKNINVAKNNFKRINKIKE